jgi:hypothetical protein
MTTDHVRAHFLAPQAWIFKLTLPARTSMLREGANREKGQDDE